MDWKALVLGAVLIFVLLNAPSHAYSTGAPVQACSTLIPSHNQASQVTESPFELDVEQFRDIDVPLRSGDVSFTHSYTPGTTYNLVLRLKTRFTNTFQGFFIQTRTVTGDSNIGGFINPPDGSLYRLSSCSIPTIGATHINPEKKTSVTVMWTAPPPDTGPIVFRYTFVENFNTFWAALSSIVIIERKCNIRTGRPFYHAPTGECVPHCPVGFTGIYELGVCQALPSIIPMNFSADIYYTTTEHRLLSNNARIMDFNIMLNKMEYNATGAGFTLSVNLVSTNVSETFFRLSNGQLQIVLSDISLFSTPSPESPFLVYSGSVIVREDEQRGLPVGNLDFRFFAAAVRFHPLFLAESIESHALFYISQSDGSCASQPCLNGGSCTGGVNSFICVCPPSFTGPTCNVATDPCATNPCQNGGICNNTEGSSFVCTCLPDYSGVTCNEIINNCLIPDRIDCNNGVCEDGNQTFICTCNPGYTGTMCAQDINECSASSCLNGNCTDLLNSYECNCFVGWTGVHCDIIIDYCDISDPTATFGPCDRTGSTACLNSNSTFTCSCVIGWTGTLCDTDIDECASESEFCANNGTCLNGFFGRITCQCLDNFTGPLCEIAPNSCSSSPCVNGGSCVDIGNGEFRCDCREDFTGNRCKTRIDVCDSLTCENGGICMENFGGSFTCICMPGYNGTLCSEEILLCTNDTCRNGGRCVKAGINISCNCLNGFSGQACDTDLNFCATLTCLSGGTCIEGIGSATSCNCTEGFNGDNCEIDLDIYCTTLSCLNGGTCLEGIGTSTSCNCTEGFSGERCETDNIFCTAVTCSNGGICLDGLGTATICHCSEGFDGSTCQNDLDFCTNLTCLNDGNCSEGVGTETSCECALGYSGNKCSIDLSFCTNETCQYGGDCMEGMGTVIVCSCRDGYSGMICDEDDDNYIACIDVPCLNGGNCVEGFGPQYSCNCSYGYDGEACENDLFFCSTVSCLNEGTCVEGIGSSTSCNCTEGYIGDSCEVDLDIFCESNTCDNNGICMEGIGTITSCVCLPQYTGENCETDRCDVLSCRNGGSCEVISGTVQCVCHDGFTGDYCDFCEGSACLNGGTCTGSFGRFSYCNCTEGFTGLRCEIDLDFYCQLRTCENSGTCMEGVGSSTFCVCSPQFTGENCGDNICDTISCLNGGVCGVSGHTVLCVCSDGFRGDLCEEDIDFCNASTCINGGICIEGVGTITSCSCTVGFTGSRCEIDIDNFCFSRTCENGGSCVEGFGSNTSCVCPPGFTGVNCGTSTLCRSTSECSSDTFCKISCPSDNYTTQYSTLLSQPLSLRGVSFLSVPQSRTPTITHEVSIFGVFRQEPGNQGYLFFYGTSPESRNLAIFLDASVDPNSNTNAAIYLYYTSTQGSRTRTLHVAAPAITDNVTHTLAVTISTSTNPGSARFFLDGVQLDTVRELVNPNLQINVSNSNPAVTFVGARLRRNFRFVGEIGMVLVFNSVLSRSNIMDLNYDYPQLLDPQGDCKPYIGRGATCPTPSVSSLVCQSTVQLCEPGLDCLPTFNGQYTCQPFSVQCTSDSDCSLGYFCGSSVPGPDKNYFDNPGASIPGEVVFLQRESVLFDGFSVFQRPSNFHSSLMTDITIFVTVCQDGLNDGYIIGKGVNDRIRDFGLYLRSSMETVWLSYGTGENNPGFRSIIFFYNVSVADEKCHSIAAVIDSSSNRALLYIDGKAAKIHAPLPSFPNFRPYFNLVYLGGRPSTRNFRFKGTMSNLFVGSAPLTANNIAELHRQAFLGGGINPITIADTSVRYCTPYVNNFQHCFVDSFENNDFKCSPTSNCVPVFENGAVVHLPIEGVLDPFKIEGRCVVPCEERCASDPDNIQCGTDGRTYANACFRACASNTAQLLHLGACENYASLYLRAEGF